MNLCRAGISAGSALAALSLSASGGTIATAQLPVEFAQRCTSLIGTDIGNAKVTGAQMVDRGAKLPPFEDKVDFAFCRVDAVAAPVPGSAIKIQMWLPEHWNGKVFGAGGGGFEGGYASAPLGLRAAAAAGYAALATDAGHAASPDPAWALNNPVAIVDYGYRANHVGAVFGKMLASRLYGTSPQRSYFQGCSNGGRDALVLAQRYPADYDAIIAGAPANNFTGVMANFVWSGHVLGSAGVDLTGLKLRLVNEAAIASCDTDDGLKDGLISNPKICRFNPAVLQCKPGQTTGCLSRADIRAVRAIYRGATTHSGQSVMPGYPIGSEYNWTEWIAARNGLGPKMGTQFYANFVYRDPNWASSAFDLDRADRAARLDVGPIINATNTNLSPFLRRGGKLLMYHGWDDAAIPAGNTLGYYSAMRRHAGSAGAAQTRLFMLPGVAHCAGGNGPGTTDYLATLDRWVTSRTPPDRLVLTKPQSVYRAMAGLPTETLMTRPVCAWPKIARYLGHGNPNVPANYSCQ